MFTAVAVGVLHHVVFVLDAIHTRVRMGTSHDRNLAQDAWRYCGDPSTDVRRHGVLAEQRDALPSEVCQA